ncbi:AMP-binding protein [Actinoplanes sp. NPDC048967]|uniref:AMP-dependent synthetase/ligase n=1 Tax=Actinoplanes sp. NPDC048967 TaxID=3155269 RepID=UPI0033D10D37
MTATPGGTATFTPVPTTMCAAFQATVRRMPDAVALRTVGGTTSYTWSEYATQVHAIAAGLAALGVRRGDTVALLLTNRPEFHLVDTAAQHLGAVPFSCYHSSSPEQINHLLTVSGARIVITERRLAGLLASSTAHIPAPDAAEEHEHDRHAEHRGQAEPRGQADQHGHDRQAGEREQDGQAEQRGQAEPQQEGQAEQRGQAEPQQEGHAEQRGQAEPHGQADQHGHDRQAGEREQDGQAEPQQEGHAEYRGQAEPHGQADQHGHERQAGQRKQAGHAEQREQTDHQGEDPEQQAREPQKPPQVIVLDGEDADFTLDDLIARGRPDFDLDASWQAVRPDDLLTLVYTSGTTGAPKGVEITHAGMVAMATASAPLLGMRAGDRLISFLPSAHIADRWANHYLHTWTGTEVTTLADPREILAALRDVRPTLFGGVPQVWQRLVAGVRSMPELAPAVDIGHRYHQAARAGEVPAELAAAYRMADERALSAVRARLGLDQVRLAITAAAPAPRWVVEFVNALGVPLSEAWGMSELSGMATMNPPDAIRPGTVGLPLPGVEIRLAADGELLVRGPMMMRGYRDRPEDTGAVLDADGWLSTGDIAVLDGDGYLIIIDRKKELLITSGGENVAPALVELAIKAHCPQVAQAVVVGDARPYLVALLVLDPEAGDDAAAAVAAGMRAANATLSRAEQVRAFEILAEAWPPGGALVTPTMKVRRRPVLRAYADRIDALYAEK